MSEPPPNAVARFRALDERLLGLEFDESKSAFLAEVLERRVQACASSVEDYLTRLASGPPLSELRALARELTVGETYFFRNREQFAALSELVLPERAALRRRPLRLLSAACASGEEAYSLAMVARERGLVLGQDVEIRAVDVNHAALEKARRGHYSAWSLRELPGELVQRWFRRERNEYVLDPELRQGVQFQEKNVNVEDAELWAPHRYDVIFCRNAVMYFSAHQAARLVRRLSDALAPGGYLFLGHAETLRGLSHDFDLRHTHETFYYQRKVSGHVRSAHVPVTPRAPEESSDAGAHWTSTWLDTVQQTSARIEQLTRAPVASTPPSAEASADAPPRRARLDTIVELLEHERFAAGLAAIEQLLCELPGDPELLLFRAALLLHAGHLELAEMACGELLAREASAAAHYLLALCHERAGKLSVAREHHRVAAHLDPTLAMPRLHLGLMSRRSGEGACARRELGQALLLLEREPRQRLILFAGGFGREALIALCRAELTAAGGNP